MLMKFHSAAMEGGGFLKKTRIFSPFFDDGSGTVQLP
jgi:hypothetical protein